jgi:hypothetical protein
MRRSLDDALLALREQVKAWANGAPPDVRVFVYPPESEALMLARLPAWAEARADEGLGVELVDVGQELARIVRERDAGGDLVALERRAPNRVLDDLRVLGQEAVLAAIARELPEGVKCRVLTNTGSMAAFVSYSAITNEFHGAATRPPAPVVISFPGDADEKSLNLLGLRPDSNYRVPRI